MLYDTTAVIVNPQDAARFEAENQQPEQEGEEQEGVN